MATADPDVITEYRDLVERLFGVQAAAPNVERVVECTLGPYGNWTGAQAGKVGMLRLLAWRSKSTGKKVRVGLHNDHYAQWVTA